MQSITFSISSSLSAWCSNILASYATRFSYNIEDVKSLYNDPH